MADILVDKQSLPVAPASGQVVMWADASNAQWTMRTDSGLFLGNQSIARASQIASHSANTYYLGMQLPSFSMQPGMTFEWVFPVSKTAGVAAPIYTIRVGPTQTVSDSVVLTMTGSAQTAVADSGLVRVLVTCRTVGTTGVIQGLVHLQHNLAATGLASTPAGMSLVQATSSGFANNALQGQYVGLSVNPGTSAAWVVEQVVGTMRY